MKNTKKKKKYNKKSLKNRLNEYEKTLIELYNSAKFEKIPLLFNRKLSEKSIERFALVYTLYRSGSYNYIEGNKILFKKNWFPESEEKSIEEATKAMESLDWNKYSKNDTKFYVMKEVDILYSNKKYRDILNQLLNIFLKKKKYNK
tara:strand:+ start:958 stop:1395 length:438 start_codon:yes stop_codon:yes gene_type:complete